MSAAFDLLHSDVRKAIWSMGWRELHPIQAQAIRFVHEQTGHVIITAQTASGKTEAAFLPIISKLIENRQPSVQALYVGPLKALINDQFQRLERICENLDIPVHRWHGDVAANSKQHLRQSPGGILLITPESLESNFINYGVKLQGIYRHLDFVVIDELHSFLNNVRGVHLLSLLTRLRYASGSDPRIIALSATLGDPEAARIFLCPDKPSSVSLINDPNSTREIKFGIRAFVRRAASRSDKSLGPRLNPTQILDLAHKLTPAELRSKSPCSLTDVPELAPTIRNPNEEEDDELDEIAEDIIRNFSNSTNLIFVNAKSTIEQLAVKLHERVKREKLPSDPFVVHHGSISKELREDAEIQLKSKIATTAICSSTLEMGIDIEGVRAVGQVDTPWSVTSLIQRLGRSGRREGEAALMRLYVRETSPHFDCGLEDLICPDLLRAVALTKLMILHWLEPPETNRMHLSTLVHQILSCLKQTGGANAPQLFTILVQLGPFRNVGAQMFSQLLKCLGNNKLIEQVPQGELILAPLGEKITSSYDFYPAFKGTEELIVLHDGDRIGNLPADLVPPVDEHFILAGRRWKVVQLDLASKSILVSPAKSGQAPKFVQEGGELHPRVVNEMRCILAGEDEPQWLNEDAKRLLRSSRTVAANSGIVAKSFVVMPHRIQWFPWLGGRGLRTLHAFAAATGIRHDIEQLSITYHVEDVDQFWEHMRKVAHSTVRADELAALMPIKAIQKFDGFISDELLDIANGHDYFDVAAAREAATNLLSASQALG